MATSFMLPSSQTYEEREARILETLVWYEVSDYGLKTWLFLSVNYSETTYKHEVSTSAFIPGSSVSDTEEETFQWRQSAHSTLDLLSTFVLTSDPEGTSKWLERDIDLHSGEYCHFTARGLLVQSAYDVNSKTLYKCIILHSSVKAPKSPAEIPAPVTLRTRRQWKVAFMFNF